MRLTKQMKEDLVNIIKNKTVNPFKKEESNLQKLLQDYIYKTNPVFKQFLDTYPNITGRFSENVKLLGSYDYIIYVMVPEFKTLSQLFGTELTSYNFSFPIKKFKNDYEMPEDLKEIYAKFVKVAEEIQEYRNLIENLHATVMSCNTDKQLAAMYPDFVQYFNAAGITKTVTKALPAKFGLPEGLSKFGLNLQTKEEKLSSLEDTIRKDIENAEEESKGTN